MHEYSYEEAAERLERWRDERKWLKKRAPACLQRPNELSLKQVEAETGVSRYRFNRSTQRLRQLLDTIVLELGGLEIEWHRDSFATKDIHLQLCKSLCMKRYEKECAERHKYFEPIRLELETLFNLLLKRSPDGAASPARHALIELKSDIERGAIRDGHRFMTYLDVALLEIDREEARITLPDELHERLCLVIAKAGLSRSRAAKMIEVAQGTFNSWCSGAKMPDKSFWPKLTSLEVMLALAPGTLVGAVVPKRAGAGRIEQTLFPPSLQGPQHTRMRAEIAQRTPPDFFDRPVAEQMQLLQNMADKIRSEKRKKRGWYDLRQDQYALKSFPEHLEAEWEALLKFKQGQTSLRDKTSKSILADTTWRKPATVKTYRARFESFFGFLSGPYAHHLRIEPSKLSLLYLASDEAHASYIRFKQERMERYCGVGRITRTDLDLVTLAASLLSRATASSALIHATSNRCSKCVIDSISRLHPQN